MNEEETSDWGIRAARILEELELNKKNPKHALGVDPDGKGPRYLIRDPHTGTYTNLVHNKNDTEPVARLRDVHPPTACALRPCAIHDCPSGHPLVDAPLVWTADINGSGLPVLYRECDHGQLHPDVDAAIYLRSTKQDSLLEHPCDGCCVGEED